MYYTGFADEAGAGIETQIAATKELGWKYMESRNIDGVNIHDLSEEKFEEAADRLEAGGVSINCFGSTVANWSRNPLSDEDFERSVSELKRAIPRMKRLNCSLIRGMSFARLLDFTQYTQDVENMIFAKVEALVRLCEEADVYFLHENCSNYGGLSAVHTLKLLDRIKSSHFKILFDTGNPVNSVDYSREDRPMQDAWKFYSDIKEFVEYVHIKDGRFKKLKQDEAFNETEWTYPGEGEGSVREIVTDLLRRGYDGGFSIEPHMHIVFHEGAGNSTEELKFRNYVEYGRRFMKLVEEVRN